MNIIVFYFTFSYPREEYSKHVFWGRVVTDILSLIIAHIWCEIILEYHKLPLSNIWYPHLVRRQSHNNINHFNPARCCGILEVWWRVMLSPLSIMVLYHIGDSPGCTISPKCHMAEMVVSLDIIIVMTYAWKSCRPSTTWERGTQKVFLGVLSQVIMHTWWVYLWISHFCV